MVRWLGVPAENFMVDENEVSDDQPALMVQLAPLLRARKDLDADDVRYLEELIGAAMRRFDAERASKSR
jgi:hypothetical protein